MSVNRSHCSTRSARATAPTTTTQSVHPMTDAYSTGASKYTTASWHPATRADAPRATSPSRRTAVPLCTFSITTEGRVGVPTRAAAAAAAAAPRSGLVGVDAARALAPARFLATQSRSATAGTVLGVSPSKSLVAALNVGAGLPSASSERAPLVPSAKATPAFV